MAEIFREFLPVIIVSAIIGAFSIVFILAWLALKKQKEDASVQLPAIYMAVGTEDFLLQNNREYKKIFEDAGVDLTYIEAPGDHNWDFWDHFIHEALDWLPLGEAVDAMGSGAIASNVSVEK